MTARLVEFPPHPRPSPSDVLGRLGRSPRGKAKGNLISVWKGERMLWLILGAILLVIAIAGGAIIHPILFALGIIALVMFFAGR